MRTEQSPEGRAARLEVGRSIPLGLLSSSNTSDDGSGFVLSLGLVVSRLANYTHWRALGTIVDNGIELGKVKALWCGRRRGKSSSSDDDEGTHYQKIV